MDRIVKIYVYEGFERATLEKITELSTQRLGVGPEEEVDQPLLSDPRWRRWHKFALPPNSIEVTFALNALLGDDRFKVVEDSDA
jgi:hypothetical protein